MTSIHELITEARKKTFEMDLTKEGLKPWLALHISQIQYKFNAAPEGNTVSFGTIDGHKIRFKDFGYQDTQTKRPVNILISLGLPDPLDTSVWYGEAVINIRLSEAEIEKNYVLGKDIIGIRLESGTYKYAEANIPHILDDLQLIDEAIDAVPWARTPAHRVSVDARG